MKKLNLGCGTDILEGWDNIDRWGDTPGVIEIDLEKAKLPYEDGSVATIKATHVLEHIFNYIELLNECHRVLDSTGSMYIEVPKFPSLNAVKDPTHIRFFTQETFLYFTVYQEEGSFKAYRIKPWKLGELSVNTSDDVISVTMFPIKENR